MTITTNPREYRGILIWPADINGSGIRWETISPIRLRADTLEGLKELIRESQKKS